MTVFAVLAAGRGTRAGGDIHKALLPLDGQAVISHQISLVPADATVIICTGHRAGQVQDYLELAHPDRTVTFVPVPGWDQPGAGPGASLLAALDGIDDDLIVASCDTLWHPARHPGTRGNHGLASHRSPKGPHRTMVPDQRRSPGRHRDLRRHPGTRRRVHRAGDDTAA